MPMYWEQGTSGFQAKDSNRRWKMKTLKYRCDVMKMKNI